MSNFSCGIGLLDYICLQTVPAIDPVFEIQVKFSIFQAIGLFNFAPGPLPQAAILQAYTAQPAH
jgi:hypothetical protein